MFFELTIQDFHAGLKRGEVTCEQLMDYYLERIFRYDKQDPIINAIIHVNAEARRQASDLDKNFRAEQLAKPLFGVPVLLKDNIDTKDMPTTAGSKRLSGFTPPEDAFLVKRLRQAGAIILAKVNLSEFACTGQSTGSLIGQTKNPYDLTHTPGGSSGGTGAGLAANFGLVGIGTDTLNSIRSPASACNLVGLRPTRGLVSRGGIIPCALTQDMAGPIARTVEDAARVLAVIAGYDDDDAVTAWSVGNASDCYTDAGCLDVNGLRNCRIGLVQSLLGKRTEHAEVNALFKQAMEDLRALGAEVVDFEGNIDADDLLDNVNVQMYELAADMTEYLKKTARISGVGNLPELIAAGNIDPEVIDKLQSALSYSKSDAEYKERLLQIGKLRQAILQKMARQRLDVLVYPLQKRLVAPINETQVQRNGILAAVTGFPAITVPCGFSSATATAPIGIPVGIDFFGRPWSERMLLRVAFAYEQATKHRKPPAQLL